MNIDSRRSSLRSWIVAGIAGLTLAGAVEMSTPAEALSIAVPSAASAVGTVSGVETIAYYRHRRYYRHGRPVPCRGSMRSHLSKRYC